MEPFRSLFTIVLFTSSVMACVRYNQIVSVTSGKNYLNNFVILYLIANPLGTSHRPFLLEAEFHLLISSPPLSLHTITPLLSHPSFTPTRSLTN